MSEKLTRVFGDPVDEGALRQIETCLADERAVAGALMADHHLGYSMPIGGVVAYEGAISPSGVGFDIACGNKAVRTPLLYDDVPDVPSIVEEIQDRVAFGMGRRNASPVDHDLFDSPVWDELPADLKTKARAQLGTVGSGNHYVDLLVDEDGYVWVACHFGSRGFGHTVASGFLAIAAGGSFEDRVKESETPAVLDLGTPGGDLYVEAMTLAGEYAYAGRDYVVDQALEILGTTSTLSVHNHHNYAWREPHYGSSVWVVRKGATPLTGELSFVGGSMGDVSVVVRRAPWSAASRDDALGSAPHGAGRVMSRTRAAGKWRKVAETRTRPDGSTYTYKRRERDASTGEIDWPAVQQELWLRGITVRGGGADEAPGVYKRLDDVLSHHSNIEVVYRLRPVGVVMAGDDVYDPYKD